MVAEVRLMRIIWGRYIDKNKGRVKDLDLDKLEWWKRRMGEHASRPNLLCWLQGSMEVVNIILLDR